MTTLGKSIVGVIIIGLIVLGGYYYTRSSSNMMNENTTMNEETASTQGTTTVTSTTTATAPNKIGKKIAFSQFIKQGGAYACTVNQIIAGGESKGTLFMNGDKVRGEFTTTVKGQSMTMNFLVLDGYSYSWTSMAPTMGFKIKQTTTPGVSANMEAMWDANQIGDYSCEAWSLDQTKFEVPTSITFRTMGS